MDYNKLAHDAMADALQTVIANTNDIFSKQIAPALAQAKDDVLADLKKDSQQVGVSLWIKVRYLIMSIFINAVYQIIVSLCNNTFKVATKEHDTNKTES